VPSNNRKGLSLVARESSPYAEDLLNYSTFDLSS
jgi:hypothetical protein